jgi:hypothetical protein
MTEKPAPAYAANRVRKNMDMDARKLAAAKRVLGARTETEAVDLALDYVLMVDAEFGALDRLAAAGGLEDVFGATAASGARHVKRGRVAER